MAMWRCSRRAVTAVVDRLCIEALRSRPFEPDHPDRCRLVALLLGQMRAVSTACFLVERGYTDLYADLHSLPPSVTSGIEPETWRRLEACYTRWVAEESNAQFMLDHDRRGRGDSEADRVAEIQETYPARVADLRTAEECPQCAVCLYPIVATTDTVRALSATCVFHRDCIDPWLLANRHCPKCRAVRIVRS